MAIDSLLVRPLSPHLRLLSPPASSRGFCSQLQYLVHKKCNTIDKSWKETVAGCHTNKHIGLRTERFTRSNGWRHLNATSEHSLEPEPEAYTFLKLWNILLSSLNVFYRFSRPHTVIGTALSIVSVSVLSVEKLADFSPPFFTGLLQALISALFMNIYIVGLNQLFDIEIDKVNKPTLPLASGEYSFRTGIAIVSVFAIMSFGIGWVVGSWPLLWALFVSFILGTAYSINLPFFRWKRFAVLAAMCIFAVRAVIVQLAFFLHIQTFVFRRPASFSKPLIFATAFMAFFSIVIALFKLNGGSNLVIPLLSYRVLPLEFWASLVLPLGVSETGARIARCKQREETDCQHSE
ncbi:hypothetical protein M5K25_009284 [Dendrobium thyrsiflorum]|uniref:Homogentisate phytyltransferase n=1 Tax=Dendrobium thyrsiflorum TaxID=117978 RepID=A0ABD0VCE3_DENTH